MGVDAVCGTSLSADGRAVDRRCLVLIIGFRVSEALLATLLYVCEVCGNSAAHRLIKRTRKFTVFFIPLFAVGSSFLDTCTYCGRTISVERDRAEAAALQGGPGLR
jgi:hypothetical protein